MCQPLYAFQGLDAIVSEAAVLYLLTELPLIKDAFFVRIKKSFRTTGHVLFGVLHLAKSTEHFNDLEPHYDHVASFFVDNNCVLFINTLLFS